VIKSGIESVKATIGLNNTVKVFLFVGTSFRGFCKMH
jgi:hypothetical protein